MDSESKVIRRQMAETRASITDKIDRLERELRESVRDASSAVAKTVENVNSTVETVQRSVSTTMNSVKRTCDVRRQVAVRPWTMMAGAAALGFAGGRYFQRNRRNEIWQNGRDAYSAIERQRNAHEYRDVSHRYMVTPKRAADEIAETLSTVQESGVLSRVTDTFRDELSMLKGLALGTLFGVVRDIATRSAPPSIERQVEDLINNVTVKLGGQPVHGHIVGEKRRREDEFASRGAASTSP